MDQDTYDTLVEVSARYISARRAFLEIEPSYDEAKRNYLAAVHLLMSSGLEMTADRPEGMDPNTYVPLSEQEDMMRDAAQLCGMDYDTDEFFEIFREGFAEFRMAKARREASKYN